jgi:hypothetical protein
MKLFEYCLQRFSKENVNLMAMIARRIWLQRNSLAFEGVFRHPNEVYAEAVSSLKEFKQCNRKEM